MNSGNCFTLPDVNAAVPVYDDPCLAGPGPGYPTVVQLSAGQVLLVTGISPDEAWWTVENPAQMGESCWLARSRADFSGDLSTLPLAEVPPAPEGNQVAQSVQITQITVDEQGRYVVAFTVSGFTPAMPGTHMHFFFDTFAAEQFSEIGGNRQMYGGASPFTGYLVIDRPLDASQLCVLVPNPGHTVIEGSAIVCAHKSNEVQDEQALANWFYWMVVRQVRWVNAHTGSGDDQAMALADDRVSRSHAWNASQAARW
jgi:hypothetical protein